MKFATLYCKYYSRGTILNVKKPYQYRMNCTSVDNLLVLKNYFKIQFKYTSLTDVGARDDIFHEMYTSFIMSSDVA